MPVPTARQPWHYGWVVVFAGASGTFTTAYLAAAVLTGIAALLTTLLPRPEAEH